MDLSKIASIKNSNPLISITNFDWFYTLIALFMSVLVTQYHQDVANPIFSIQEYLDGNIDRIVARRALPIIMLKCVVSTGISGKSFFTALEVVSLFITFLTLKFIAIKQGFTRFQSSITGVLFVYSFAFMALLPNKLNIFYPSDFLSLLFFLLGFFLISKNYWWALFILIPLASTNRETSVLLIPLFFFTQRSNIPLFKLFLISTVLLIEWWGVKQWLIYTYPSELASYQDQYHSSIAYVLEMFQKKSLFRLAFLLGVYGFLWVPIALNFKSIFKTPLALGTLIVVILHYLLMFTFSNVFEYRWGIEMLGFVVILSANSIREIWNQETKNSA
jgi:hypothetical protein